MNLKCQLKLTPASWEMSVKLTPSDTRKSGTDSPHGIQCSYTGFYVLLQPACRPLSIFAKVTKVDTCQLPIPLSIAGWNGWLTCRCQSWMWLSRMPTYLSTGYCSTGYGQACYVIAPGTKSMWNFMWGETPNVPSKKLVCSCSTHLRSSFCWVFKWLSWSVT